MRCSTKCRVILKEILFIDWLEKRRKNIRIFPNANNLVYTTYSKVALISSPLNHNQ